MTVPTSAAWTLDADGIVDEAAARIRRITGRQQSGYDLKRAVRALQLLMAELNLRGVQLWAINEWTQALAADENDVSLNEEIQEVLEAYIRLTDGTDLPLQRMSRAEMMAIPNKSSTGRPLRFWCWRGRDGIVVRFWPVPDAAYTMYFQAVVALRDITGMLDNIDAPTRWMPTIISGLTYFMARGTEGMPSAEVEQFKSEWEADYLTAVSDDRERVPFTIQYDLSAYTRS